MIAIRGSPVFALVLQNGNPERTDKIRRMVVVRQVENVGAKRINNSFKRKGRRILRSIEDNFFLFVCIE